MPTVDVTGTWGEVASAAFALVALLFAWSAERRAGRAETAAKAAEKRSDDTFKILHDEHEWTREAKAREEQRHAWARAAVERDAHESRIRELALRWCREITHPAEPGVGVSTFRDVASEHDREAAELLELNGCGEIVRGNDGRTLCEIHVAALSASPGLVPTLRFYRERLAVSSTDQGDVE